MSGTLGGDARRTMLREPHELRDYQRRAVEAALRRNLLCVLPPNAGKTIIAADLIRRTMRSENEEGGKRRRMVFLAPTRGLAMQQAIGSSPLERCRSVL